jgi:hypothetical protein
VEGDLGSEEANSPRMDESADVAMSGDDGNHGESQVGSPFARLCRTLSSFATLRRVSLRPATLRSGTQG